MSIRQVGILNIFFGSRSALGRLEVVWLADPGVSLTS
jgi:hypothetical protein